MRGNRPPFGSDLSVPAVAAFAPLKEILTPKFSYSVSFFQILLDFIKIDADLEIFFEEMPPFYKIFSFKPLTCPFLRDIIITYDIESTVLFVSRVCAHMSASARCDKETKL